MTSLRLRGSCRLSVSVAGVPSSGSRVEPDATGHEAVAPPWGSAVESDDRG